MKKNALIATIGSELNSNGTLADAIFRSVDPNLYDLAALIASPQSVEGARRLAERLGWPEPELSIHTLESAHDLDEVFRTVNACINRFISHGYEANRITINYTSGTKVMSSGAVLSAIYNSCDSLQYITGAGSGNRRQETLFTRPRSVFAYQELMRAHRHLLARQFGSAQEALNAIDGSLLTDYDCRLSKNLLFLVQAYRAWESNDIAGFFENYDQVLFEQSELAAFELAPGQRPAIEQLSQDFGERRPSPLLCVDMRNTAHRALLGGSADDASERLYRALEFLSQWKLAEKYKVMTDDVDIRKVPPRYRPIYEALRSMEDGKIRIGMRKSYELLALLNDGTGGDFAADEQLQSCLKKRDWSLLAHGVTPVSPVEGEEFLRVATLFFKRQIERFDDLARALQFPWLSNKAAADPRTRRGTGKV